MERNTVLSLSPNRDALRARETTLRDGGWKVVSVMTPTQARFEIEMGRCGILLICYRLSTSDANDLCHLFRKNCPKGRIVFVTEPVSHWKEIPVETNVAIPESSGPELLLGALKENTSLERVR